MKEDFKRANQVTGFYTTNKALAALSVLQRWTEKGGPGIAQNFRTPGKVRSDLYSLSFLFSPTILPINKWSNNIDIKY